MDGNNEETPLRAAFYLRVSTDDQVDKFGLDIQRTAAEAVLRTKGKLKNGGDSLIFAGEKHVYVDEGVSGTIGLDERPAFSQLKEDYLYAPRGGKPFDVIIVFKIDRFARKLKILMDVMDFFEKTGISFISATESIDTSTPFGRAMIGIMGVLAELERENILSRTHLGREEAIERGVVMGANAPYGYQKDNQTSLVRFNDEATVVERIFNLFNVSKLSPQQIADILKKEEILSPDASAVHYGKRKGSVRKTNDLHHWRMETVRSILMDDVYTGIRYKAKSKNGKPLPRTDWELLLIKHEPIIPKPLFEFAQRRLSALSARRTLSKKKIEKHMYLLSGLLKCDHCRKLGTSKDSEASWTGARKYVGKKYSYSYQCNRKNRKKYPIICPVIPIPASELEKYVKAFVKELLIDPKATYEYQRNLDSTRLNTKRLKAERELYRGLLNALPKRKVNILKQHEIGAFDNTVLQEKLTEWKNKEGMYLQKMDEIDNQLSKEVMSIGYEASLELYSQKYKEATNKAFTDDNEMYELLHMIIHQIVVYSRPKLRSDHIAGRKKEDQLIPDKIDIQLKLPQDLLQELITQGFGVKSANL